MIYILSDKKVENTENLTVIEIKFLKKEIKLKDFDVIIFTSQNGVLALNKLNRDWINIASLAIGKATATKIKNLGGNLVYTSNTSHGDLFANEIISLLKDKKVLYIRAKKVASNLISILKEAKISIIDEILYETKCKECSKLKKPEKNSYVIFSSPSTIDCFFKYFEWDYSYKAVAIGKTTAKYIPNNIKFLVSPTQTLKGCVEFIRALR